MPPASVSFAVLRTGNFSLSLKDYLSVATGNKTGQVHKEEMDDKEKEKLKHKVV